MLVIVDTNMVKYPHKFGEGCIKMASLIIWRNCMRARSSFPMVFPRVGKITVTLFGQTWRVDEDLVAEVNGLQKDDINFYRDRKFSVEAIKNFPKNEEERACIAKKDNISYYLPNEVNSFWQKMLKVLMEYLTIDGRFSKVYNYHFVILNHFRHGSKISLPFYLASSLNDSLADHAKKPNSSSS